MVEKLDDCERQLRSMGDQYADDCTSGEMQFYVRPYGMRAGTGGIGVSNRVKYTHRASHGNPAHLQDGDRYLWQGGP